MVGQTYTPLSECRGPIQEYGQQLEAGTDDADKEARSSKSTTRYLQDIRWFDGWLDEQEIESIEGLSSPKVQKLGISLSREFNGTTGRYRWDRIYKMYDWFRRMDYVNKNEMEKWNDDKDELWTLTKSTEQEKQLGEDENYAPTAKEIELIIKNVPAPRLVHQLCIKLMYQTGMRREECASIELDMLDRKNREIRLSGRITKNGKPRTVPYQESLDGLMMSWLDDGGRDEALRGKESDRLFVGPRGGKWDGQHINKMVSEAATEAGINRVLYKDSLGRERVKISSHNIRHAYGTYMVQKTEAGLWEVSQLMGHSSVSITEDLYVEDNDEAGLEHGHQYGPE